MQIRSAHAVVSLVVAFALAAASAAPARAQNVAAVVGAAPAAAASGPRMRDIPKDILADQKAIWTSPFHLHGGDVRWLLPFALTTAALLGSDKEVNENVLRSTDAVSASNHVSNLGSSVTLFGVSAGFYFAGRAVHNERARATGLLGGEALVDAFVVSQALKIATNRERPNKANGRQDFYDGGKSFPSGHATSSWAFAEVVAEQYSDHPAVRWGAYGLATAVSVARVTSLHHSPSDVFVGAALGYLIGRHVAHRAGDDGGHVSLDVTPMVNPSAHAAGVIGTISF